jgi:Zincin-like metallopeptidase
MELDFEQSWRMRSRRSRRSYVSRYPTSRPSSRQSRRPVSRCPTLSGTPLTQRGSAYAGVPPDKITIYREPLERLYGADREGLRRQIRRVLLHEVLSTLHGVTGPGRVHLADVGALDEVMPRAEELNVLSHK